MIPLQLRWAPVTVIVGYLALNGWLHLHIVNHALDHMHHQAATHTNPICSWLCAAGQTVQTSDLTLENTFQLVAIVESASSPTIPATFVTFPFSRGPPSV